MNARYLLVFSAVSLALILGACAPAAPDAMTKPTATPEVMVKATPPADAMMKGTPTPEVMLKETPDAMAKETPDAMMQETPEAMAQDTPDAMMKETETPDAMMKETPDAMMKEPAWFGAEFTDVNKGTKFTLSGFKGKVVLVETMAQWCPTCLRQQNEIKALHAKLGMPADLVTLTLDIDANEDTASLKAYAAKNGFDWLYAVPSAEVAREIGNLYGSQFLNPPSAPILVIDRAGAAHPLSFGLKSADDLAKALEPYLKGM